MAQALHRHGNRHGTRHCTGMAPGLAAGFWPTPFPFSILKISKSLFDRLENSKALLTEIYFAPIILKKELNKLTFHNKYMDGFRTKIISKSHEFIISEWKNEVLMARLLLPCIQSMSLRDGTPLIDNTTNRQFWIDVIEDFYNEDKQFNYSAF